MTSVPADDRTRIRLAVAAVCAAAILPYLSTLNNYFVRDDFGVVQLLASKPATYFPRWFVSQWTDQIYGYVADEVRPFPAVSYQLTALGGAASPYLHHVANVAFHAGNALVVFDLARTAAGTSPAGAALAGVTFALLPVHPESVAWITGRVDSMPALFYMMSFAAYVRWRERRALSWYLASVLMCFVALFTKQTAITLVATLAAWDFLVQPVRLRSPELPRGERSRSRAVAAYVPFILLTIGYLLLRYLLFRQVVREDQLNAEGLAFFFRLAQRHLTHVVAGRVDAVLAAWVVVILLTVCAAVAVRRMPRDGRGSAVRELLFFGPVWWAIGIAPVAVAGYESPRHVYLAAAAWAFSAGLVFDLLWRTAHASARRVMIAVSVAALVVYAVELNGAVREWNTIASVSRAAVQDVRREALSRPPGSLLIVGAPVRSWEWAVPFSVRPPFTRTDLTTRVFVVTPWLLHCCRGEWFEDTRRILEAWQAGPRGSIVVLTWDQDTGDVGRISDAEYPALRDIVSVLPGMKTRDALDAAILRIVRDLPAPPSASRRLK
jgi:hypothetical protein